MKTFKVLEFAKINASLGGAQRIAYGKRSAEITRANGSRVTVPLSSLPPLESWTAFNLADIADKVCTRKAVQWSYPTSTNAGKMGFGKAGCWTVEAIRFLPAQQPPVPLKGFADKGEAIAYAETLEHDWHGDYPTA